MSDFENIPNVNNSRPDSAETQKEVSVGTKKTEKNLENLERTDDNEKEQNGEQTTLPEKSLFESDSKKSKTNIEQESEKEKITEVISQINDIDEKIFRAKKHIGQDEAKLRVIRESMGLPMETGMSPMVSFNNDRIERLENDRNELIKQKEEWVDKFGKDNFPEGLATEESEDGREVKGAQLSIEEKTELTDKEKQEQTEKRREWLETWKKKAIVKFEKGMRNDWRTKDAINLDFTIEVMKMRVPNAMEKEMKDFVEGKNDEPPSVVWIHWKCNSLFDHVLGKPNTIKSLEITFDKEIVELAGEKDLEKKDKKNEESKSEEKPKEETLRNESK